MGAQGSRKLILTVQIEKRYTKREIFALYCNHVPWGHGIYGAEAASRFYFGKSAKDLTLEEAALLAGIVQPPARQSPYVSVERATRRRNYALQRMADDGYISAAQAARAKQAPVVTAGRPSTGGFAPFYLEDVRQHLEERYGAKRLYQGGLAVHTSLDAGASARRREGLRCGPAPHRQAPRLPAAHPQRHRRQTDRRRLQARPLDAPDGSRATSCRPSRAATSAAGAPRAIAGGRDPAARRQVRSSRSRKAGYAWTRKTSPDFVQGRRPGLGAAPDAATRPRRFGTGALEQDPADRRRAASPSTTRPGRFAR